MTELQQAILKLKGNRSIRQMATDTGVTATYISGIIKGKYPNPSLKIIGKLTCLESKPQANITADKMWQIISRQPLSGEYNIDLEERTKELTKKLAEIVDELNEIAMIRRQRYIDKLV